MAKRAKNNRAQRKLPAPVPQMAMGSIITSRIRTSTAASIGRTIIVHSAMEWALAKILYNLMGISIKQGRVSFRMPPATQYVKQLRQHLQFHKIKLRGFRHKEVTDTIEAANEARNALAHSIYTTDPKTGKMLIQLVTGAWEFPGSGNYETLHRALQPQSKVVDRAFLNEQRRAVNKGLKCARRLQRVTNRAIQERRSDPKTGRNALRALVLQGI